MKNTDNRLSLSLIIGHFIIIKAHYIRLKIGTVEHKCDMLYVRKTETTDAGVASF